MKILIALPDNNYYVWQIMVQINNFRKMGIENDVIYVVGKHRGCQYNSNILKIAADRSIKCNFHFFEDQRKNLKYGVSFRHNILAQFFDKYPFLNKETFLFTDPDVIFTKKMDFTKYENDNIWYLSDTRSYINSDYIKSKGVELFKGMCNIVGVSPSVIEQNDENAGGAQYIMKNVDATFWRKCEKDSELLYEYMVSTSNIYCPKFPIQSWTADMWAVLWNAIYFNHEVKIDKGLDFAWATDSINRWGECQIFHNAGVTENNGILFMKTAHQLSPFNKSIEYSDKFCSYNYVKEIKETEISLKNLIF
jgi:hypothetical protein